MRPRAQCSTLCVWPLTKPGTSMRSEQSSSTVPGGQSTSSERVPPGATRFRTPSAMRTSRRVYFPGSEASLGTSAPRSRVGGPAGGAGERENFPTELSSVRSMVAEPPVRACAHPRAPICAGGRFLSRARLAHFGTHRFAKRRPHVIPNESHTTQMPNWISGCPSDSITLCKTDVRTKPEFFSGDFEKRKSAEIFDRANSFDHLIAIKFQRISAKKLLKFSGLARTSVLQRVITLIRSHPIITSHPKRTCFD